MGTTHLPCLIIFFKGSLHQLQITHQIKIKNFTSSKFIVKFLENIQMMSQLQVFRHGSVMIDRYTDQLDLFFWPLAFEELWQMTGKVFYSHSETTAYKFECNEVRITGCLRLPCLQLHSFHQYTNCYMIVGQVQ